MTPRRIAGVAIGVLICAGAAILVWALPAPLPVLPPTIAARTPDVAHGAYLATIGDCTACHTKPGGPAFAGGVPFTLPMGVIYASNITPDPKYGIGNYSLPDFIRLMRDGVAHDGRRIYPAMPYTSFTKVSDGDLQDLYAYFETRVAPAAIPSRPPDIGWPLSIRWPLALWDKAFLDNTRFQPDPTKPHSWNRGAYIVEGLGHCGTCHTPRGIAIQEDATTDSSTAYLSGAVLDGQSVSDLRENAWTGLKNWTQADIVELLQTARTAHAAIAGQMTEVVKNSTQYMQSNDLQAVATYLKSLAPAPQGPSTFAPNPATITTILDGQATSEGAHIYMDSCAACHQLNGEGYDHAFPRLAGNATVLAPSPDSLLSAIIAGARLPSTANAPSALAMPAFGWRYSDAKIAALATFVRTAWGNHAPPVTAADVHQVRAVTMQRSRER
jgi:mono/diheme cytochrome c family protein